MNPDAANAARCQDRTGTYEAWYVTVAEPAQRRGYWIRYSTLNPAPGVDAQAHSALWAFSFDHDDPGANWGAKVVFPLRALRVESRPFVLRLNGALMMRNGCSGQLHSERGSARWDLRWDSREPPFPFLRPGWQMLSTVANIGVQPALRISGTIEINGQTHHLEHAPGGQQHTWGSSHALEWNWGFAAGDDFWLDGATSRVRSRLGRVLVGTAVGAHARDHRFLFNGPIRVLRTRGPISPESWTAHARLGERELSVTVRPRREDLIGVTYTDPRGGTRFCYHTEVADLSLRLTRHDEPLVRISRPAAAAFEYASETAVAGVPLLA
ncbi:hypothetical protein EPN29_00250 [bacterium]|nr:MAG: hypothetical protein EPN29_00250 [bacterium]